MEKLLITATVICFTGIYSRGDPSAPVLRLKPHNLKEVETDERVAYVEFTLRTRDNKKEPEKKIFQGGLAPVFDYFSPEKETVVLIPGATIFGQGYSFYYTSFFSYAFLRNGDYNVISVQWDHLIDLNLIKQTLRNAVFVGELTAALIKSLRKDYKKINGFNIIGHHYGTISAATAGAVLHGKLERITALDPQTIPLNVKLPHWAQLRKSCAEIVEVIHTSGHTSAMGHRDFYPNGGIGPQPGCVYDFFDYCSTEKSFLMYGTDVIMSGHYYNATNCDTYENYINHKCDHGDTISLWNRENRYSLPVGSYFFRTLPELEQEQPSRRNIQFHPRRPQKHAFPRPDTYGSDHWIIF